MVNDNVPSVAAAMEDVARWRAETEAKVQGELAEVDQEIGGLMTALENLQKQIEALNTFRGEVVAKQSTLGDGEGAQVYDGVFRALVAQAAALGERSTVALAAENAKKAAAMAAVSDPETQSLMEEYQQFVETVEPTLAHMPASYRDIIAKHHHEVTAKLEAKMAAADTSPAVIEAEELSVDIVFGVDAPDGVAEIIMVVLPVTEAVQNQWNSRPDDLQTALAARSVQAVYQACRSVGFPTAQAMFGGHQGLLAVELELPGGDPGPIQSALQVAFDQILGDAPELAAAKVRASGHYALVDHLLPPEDEMDESQEMSNA